MFKKFLSTIILFLVLILHLQDSFAFSESVCRYKTENMTLFHILNDAEKIITESDNTEETQVALELINKEILLFNDIIAEFNKGVLIYVHARFFSICNHFKNNEFVEPRHLRFFEAKVIKFDKFVQKYCIQHRSFLSADEIKLCKMLRDFDESLISNFLKYEYFEIDIFDRITDWTIYRPIEGAKAHPMITAAIGLAVLAVVGVYIYKLKQRQDAGLDDAGYPGDVSQLNDCANPSENGNGGVHTQPEVIPPGTVIQEFSIEPQHASWCGKHALVNVVADIEGFRAQLKSAQSQAAKVDVAAALKTRIGELENDWACSIAEYVKAEDLSQKSENMLRQTDIISNFRTDLSNLCNEYNQLPKRSFWQWIKGSQENPTVVAQRTKLAGGIRDVRKKLLQAQDTLSAAKADFNFITEQLKNANDLDINGKKQLFNDLCGDYIVRLIEDYCVKNKINTCNVHEISQLQYLTAMDLDSKEIDKCMTDIAERKNAIQAYFTECKNTGVAEDNLAIRDTFYGLDGDIWKNIIKPIYTDFSGSNQSFDSAWENRVTRDNVAEILSVERLSIIGGYENSKTGYKIPTPLEARDNLWNKGTPIYFIINLSQVGYGPLKKNRLRKAHYIMYKVYKDENQIRIAFSDSMKGDYSRDYITNVFYRFFVKPFKKLQ